MLGAGRSIRDRLLFDVDWIGGIGYGKKLKWIKLLTAFLRNEKAQSAVQHGRTSLTKNDDLMFNSFNYHSIKLWTAGSCS